MDYWRAGDELVFEIVHFVAVVYYKASAKWMNLIGTIGLGTVVVVMVIVVWWFMAAKKMTVGGNLKWDMAMEYSNEKDAARLLYDANEKIMFFLWWMRRRYGINEVGRPKFGSGVLREVVRHILLGYNPERFHENDPRFSADSSYTVNKGDDTYFCLRDRGTPEKLVDEGTMLFVMLHELAHMGNYDGWGHDTNFWEKFKFVLREAQICGIYQPVAYEEKPKMYCGVNIVYNPLLDSRLRSIWIA